MLNTHAPMRRILQVFTFLFSSFLFTHCAPLAEVPPPKKAVTPALKPSVWVEPAPSNSISRSSIHAALEAGLGRFLSTLEIEPVLNSRRQFVGWKILQLHNPEWAHFDLKPGDTITRINGFRIERDHQAHQVFHSLAVASEIRVSLIRDQKAQEIRIAIVDTTTPNDNRATSSDHEPKTEE